MMTKHKLEYWLTLFIGFIAKVVPLKLALRIGDVIGDLFYFVIRTRKKVALRNLKQVFGAEKNDKELKQILRQNYRHFGRTLMEFARIPVLTRENILQQISINSQDIERIQQIYNKREGVLVLTGHFGNWEYLAAVLARIKPPLHCVFKEQKNLAVDAIIKKYRTNLGLVPLKVKGGAAKGVLNALQKKEMVLIVMDQDAGRKGIFVDFLGKSASTARGPAQIAIKHRIPVIMAFGVRGSNGKIHVETHEFPGLDNFSNDEQGLIKFIQAYNKILEKYIRQYPEQWFWMHRRWKTRPVNQN